LQQITDTGNTTDVGIVFDNGVDEVDVFCDEAGNLRVTGNLVVEGDVVAYAGAGDPATSIWDDLADHVDGSTIDYVDGELTYIGQTIEAGDGLTLTGDVMSLGGTFDETLSLISTNGSEHGVVTFLPDGSDYLQSGSNQFPGTYGFEAQATSDYPTNSDAVIAGLLASAANIGGGVLGSYLLAYAEDAINNTSAGVNIKSTGEIELGASEVGSTFKGAKYTTDNSSEWGTINNTNLFIPHVGWIVDYVKTPSFSDKEITATATSSDGDTSGASLSATPTGYVQVMVNGVQVVTGDAVKTKTCYWSRDSGTTALALNALASGDTLYWNGSIAGFQLTTSHIITFNYMA
jgi:hypothetical protein